MSAAPGPMPAAAPLPALQALGLVCRRDLRLALRSRAELALVLVFFLLVMTLFPLGVGPEPALLARIAPGIAWVAALLASLLSLPRLFANDHADGSLEQLVLAPASLPALPAKPHDAVLDRLRQRQQAMGRPSPFFEYAMRWLEAHAPEPPARLRLVHGDFRNGNLIIGPDGVRAVLDWEVAHLGDPAADLAWLCLPPWRFGQLDRPAGGLGSREALLQAYVAAGGEPLEPERLRFWEALGSLRWWMGCAGMFEWFDSGRDASVERAMIARRVSESELDLLRLIAGRN